MSLYNNVRFTPGQIYIITGAMDSHLTVRNPALVTQLWTTVSFERSAQSRIRMHTSVEDRNLLEQIVFDEK